MYCLDCGTKILEDELQCPNCGSSVAEMQERIAEAEEKIAYTDAVAPRDTTKLPLVSERRYVDSDGNPLDPAKKVDLKHFKRDARDLTAIPEIGDEDPYLTKPMQRIVSDTGKVVADVDREVKTYRQAPEKRKAPVKAIVGVLLVAAAALGCVAFGPQAFEYVQGALSQAAQEEEKPDDVSAVSVEDSQEEVDPAQAHADALAAFNADVQSAYLELASWRIEVDQRVTDFEGYFLVVDREVRSGYAEDCTALIQEITESREALAQQAEEAGLALGDEGYEQYQDVDLLYGYLLDRLGVIAQCWEIDATYDDPRGSESAILEPLYQDLDQGNSISETAFDELYPTVYSS